jgi:anti-sigma-K factor RskA
MKIATAELRHALAAEYVLGTMRGRARERFRRLAESDRELAAVVAQWEDFLTPLAGGVAPVEPPSRVWAAIESRIASRNARGAPARGLWSSLAFWRTFGLGLTAMAVLIMLFGPLRAPAPSEPLMVAVLAAADQVPRMIVEQAGPGVLKVRMVKGWPTLPGNDLELWVVPKEGAPRSLGVVSYEHDSELRIANLDQALKGGVTFAISKEPAGGSRTGAPSGPVLCSGSIARTKRA